MLKINKSILIICTISLFLIIGQISASDTDLIEINESDTINNTINNTIDNTINNTIDKPIENPEINSIADSIELNESNSIDDSMELKDSDSIDDSMELKDSDSIDDSGEDEIIEKNEKLIKSSSVIVMSNDNYSCGAASFATALNNMGMNISLDEAKLAANTSTNGTTMKGLIDAAEKYNLTAIGVYADSSNLKENFIVHMNINGAEHWSVIKEISKDSVTLADPSLGYVKYDLGKFNEFYTKNSLIILNKTKLSSLDMSPYTIIDNAKLNSISGKGYAYYYSKKISYIHDKVNPGYAFQVKIIVPKWGGKTVKIITKKITSHKICCNVYYKITYYKKAKYKGKSTVINYPCIFNLSMKKGKTVTVNLPTPGIRSFRFYHTVCKFP